MRAESIIRDGKESFGGTGGEGEPKRTGSSEAADVYDVVQRNLHASLWGPEGAAAAGCLCSCSKVGKIVRTKGRIGEEGAVKILREGEAEDEAGAAVSGLGS